MKSAKPLAARILSSMAAGSLYGIAAYRVYEIGLSPSACEILAILCVGFLMQFASVLINKKLEAISLTVCFAAFFSAEALANNQLTQYPITAYLACTCVALLLCDKAIKKFT